MRVCLGSTNRLKGNVCERVFRRYFGAAVVDRAAARSGVPETPYGPETLAGARNRARGCVPGSGHDYYVGLESGLVERYGGLYEEAWACVLAPGPAGRDREVLGYSSGLPVPAYVRGRMARSGRPHYLEMEQIERERGLDPDTWSVYTGGGLARAVSLEEALRNAVVQLLPHPDSLYRRED